MWTVEEFLDGGERSDTETFRSQQASKRIADIWIVIDYHDGGLRLVSGSERRTELRRGRLTFE